MAIPRPVLIALLGLALCGAAFVATRGASDTGGAVTQAPATAPKATLHSAVKPAHKPAPAHRAHKPTASHPRTHKAAPAKPTPAKAHAKPAAKPATPAKPSAAAIATTKMLSVLAAV